VRAGLPLLPFVRGCGEAERPRDELGVDRVVIRGDVGEQLIEQALMLLTCLECRHCLSVLRVSNAVSPRKERTFPGRSDGFHVQESAPRGAESREARARVRGARRRADAVSGAGTAPGTPPDRAVARRARRAARPGTPSRRASRAAVASRARRRARSRSARSSPGSL